MSSSKPLWWQNSPLCCHFELLWCEMIWKSWKTQKICWCDPSPWNENFWGYLQKWDTLVAKRWGKLWIRWLAIQESIWASFWGKRWKNLQNDQNWPFGANLSHLFGKIHHCGSLLTCFSVKWFKKVEELKKNWPMYPPGTKIFEISAKILDALVVSDGKSCESGEIGHSKSLLETHFGTKVWKNLQNWPFWVNLKPLWWQNRSLRVMLRCLDVIWFKKVEKLIAFVDVSPQDSKFLRWLRKMSHCW